MFSRFAKPAAAIALLGVAAAATVAASRLGWFGGDSQDRTRCLNAEHRFTPDESIAGCTAAIEAADTASARSVVLQGRGIAYQAKGEQDRAIVDYDEAIRIDPKSATAFTNRGNAYFGKGDMQRALADYNEALRLNARLISALLARSELYRRQGKFDRAIADGDEAIRLDPREPAAFNDRGLTYLENGAVNLAIADFDEAIRLNPDRADSFYDRGYAYLQKSDYNQAIADFNETIRLRPAFAFAFINRGNAYRGLGDLAGAIADFKDAVKLDPKNPEVFWTLGRIDFNAGDYAAAASDLARAAELKPDQAYFLIWRYLAQARAGSTDARAALGSDAGKLDAAKWPYPVVELYLGQRSAEATLAAPGNADDRCEAQFYIGEWRLLQDDWAAAMEALKIAADTCPKTFIEYEGSRAALKRLEK